MVVQTLFCRAPEGEYDPFRNLAVEKYLTFRVQEGQCILFLWQNRRTVVIGRNQNAWKECNTAALAADGGHLARRLSGGGAVFHDLGNLNFSFCVRREDYDVDRQLEVIRRALLREGIEACKSGRNDLL
ncbi:MAG: lipoate--protein ligase, partial [Lachnospiraceae bacterium]|nr:lipoate--protein ligase [Lachnospiraceae bacterium]